MRKPTRRRSKYYAPQNEGGDRLCDHPGCSEKGEYRAPKDRHLKEYYWFCLKHVQEYNARWNYYDGTEPEEEPRRDSRRRFRFSDKVKYNFGFDFKGNFEFFDDYSPGFSASENEPYFNENERRCLRVMELKAQELTVEQLKKQYKKLVKKYHPDINRDDRDAEEKFKLLGEAYQTLLKKLSRC